MDKMKNEELTLAVSKLLEAINWKKGEAYVIDITEIGTALINKRHENYGMGAGKWEKKVIGLNIEPELKWKALEKDK